MNTELAYTTTDLFIDLRGYNPQVYDIPQDPSQRAEIVPLERLSRLEQANLPLKYLPFEILHQKWNGGWFPKDITTLEGQTLARIEAKTPDKKLIIQLTPAGREYLTD
ncbi:MAG: hypothetical protein RL557_623 [archaeon]|jgi:hypothetical protein